MTHTHTHTHIEKCKHLFECNAQKQRKWLILWKTAEAQHGSGTVSAEVRTSSTVNLRSKNPQTNNWIVDSKFQGNSPRTWEFHLFKLKNLLESSLQAHTDAHAHMCRYTLVYMYTYMYTCTRIYLYLPTTPFKLVIIRSSRSISIVISASSSSSSSSSSSNDIFADWPVLVWLPRQVTYQCKHI